MEPNLTLVVTYSDGSSQEWPVPKGKTLLGSSPECPLMVKASGVESRHVEFLVKGNRVFVSNLCEQEPLWFRGRALHRRPRRFNIGNELAIGDVRVTLRQISEAGGNQAGLPDGTAKIAGNVRKIVSSGWRGNREILKRTAEEISPEEAKTAEQRHRDGQRALRWCISIVVALAVLGWFFASLQCFDLKQAIYCIDLYAVLIFALALTALFHIRNAGRLLLSLQAILFWAPPRAAWVVHFHFMRLWVVTFACALFCLGWLVDTGAGCVFEWRRMEFERNRADFERLRRAFVTRYLLLLFAFAVLCALALLPYYRRETPPPGEPWWFFPLPAIALTYPLWSLGKAPIRPARALSWRGVLRLFSRRWLSRKIGCSWYRIRHSFSWDWVSRRADRSREEHGFDVAFVAELASYRSGRRLRARIATVFLLSIPLIIILGSLGSRERIVWDPARDDGGLVVTESASGEKTAWYRASRGRYLAKSDFGLRNAPIYQVPLDALLAPEREDGTGAGEIPDDPGGALPSRKAARMGQRMEKIGQKILGARPGMALSGLGRELCRKLAAVQADATNTLHYAELKRTLAPYRIAPSDTDKFAEGLTETPSPLVVFLEEVDNRANYNSGPDPKLHTALLYCGERRDGELQGYTAGEARREARVIATKVVPSLVLVALASLFLWKRGGDSPLGFWLGVALSFGALFQYLSPAFKFTDEPMMEYQLWRLALNHSVGSLFSAWFALLTVVKTRALYFVFMACTPTALFILLCWPGRSNSRNESVWRRAIAFIGKFVAVLGSIALAGLASFLVSGKSLLLTRVIAMLVVGAAGAWLRRTRRNFSEAPYIGWEFFTACFLLDLSAALPKAAGFGLDPLIPESWLAPLPWLGGGGCMVGLVAGVAALAGGGLFLTLCLRKNFLSVMSPNGFSIALLAFSIPIFTSTCESLTEEVFHGSFLQSEQGERILSIAVIILILSPLWKTLQRLSRYILQPNLSRVEDDVEKTMERVLDDPGARDAGERISRRLEELGIKRYGFYKRGPGDTFVLKLNKGWTGNPLCRVSPYLREFLGKYLHAIDLDRVEHDDDLFFHSFELWRIRKNLKVSCLLPICLGRSVRAILVTPADDEEVPIPDSDVLRENMNKLGLATIASVGGEPPAQES